MKIVKHASMYQEGEKQNKTNTVAFSVKGFGLIMQENIVTRVSMKTELFSVFLCLKQNCKFSFSKDGDFVLRKYSIITFYLDIVILIKCHFE